MKNSEMSNFQFRITKERIIVEELRKVVAEAFSFNQKKRIAKSNFRTRKFLMGYFSNYEEYLPKILRWKEQL
jgi:hypothetical protein